MRYPMFGAILILRLAWDLIATGRALPWHTLGIAALPFDRAADLAIGNAAVV